MEIKVPLVFSSTGNTPHSVFFGEEWFAVPEEREGNWVVKHPETKEEFLVIPPNEPGHAWQILALAESD